jgi:hypothetical protein
MTASIPHFGPPLSRGVLPDLAANLVCGLRAALFRAPPLGQWRPFAEQILALALLDVMIGLGPGLLEHGRDGHLDWTALPRALLPVPVALLAGWLLARRSGRPSLLGATAVTLLAVTIWFDLASGLLGMALWRGWSVVAPIEPWSYLALFAWWAVALGLAVARLARDASARAWSRIADATLAAVVMVLPFWYVPDAPLWQGAAGDTEEVDSYAVSREEVFYGQPGLLEAALARLAPQRPGVEDVYFVGVAGYASEDVFLNEAELAEDVLRSRFDTGGRSVLLANNARTVRTLPVASVTALRRALRAVGQAMDPDEDVLFLFLTTHGSPDHSLAMDFWPLQLQGLTPEVLRQMLDEAGVRWRVIVISACFSGGFVDGLKSDTTLLMTAADAARSSFGCGPDSDLTYFGRAFFGDALTASSGLVEAFGVARETIRRREQAAGFEASNPQIHVGSAIGDKLARMERRLAAAGRLPARAPCVDRPSACGPAGPQAN